jgi:hypothetical protein
VIDKPAIRHLPNVAACAFIEKILGSTPTTIKRFSASELLFQFLNQLGSAALAGAVCVTT